MEQTTTTKTLPLCLQFPVLLSYRAREAARRAGKKTSLNVTAETVAGLRALAQTASRLMETRPVREYIYAGQLTVKDLLAAIAAGTVELVPQHAPASEHAAPRKAARRSKTPKRARKARPPRKASRGQAKRARRPAKHARQVATKRRRPAKGRK